MASMTVPAFDPQADQLTRVVGGVDTHKDLHVAAVVAGDGTVLGTESFSTTRAGYRALLRWMRSFGDLRRVGIEGTGSYGAGVTRHGRCRC
jgi:transposase